MSHILPFALPDIGDEEIQAVVSAMKSSWLTTGPICRQFESDFAKYFGNDLIAISVNSATAGLHLALESLNIGLGDEVITSIFTFTATAEVIRYLGAHPVFVDIDPTTLNLDVSQIRKKITNKTKAIMPVHFGGLPCSMKEIFEIANLYNIKIIEDAAHALPSKYDNCLIGALNSDVTVFSFYATKTLTTGEGGMIVTRNQALANRMKIMRLHGISRDVFGRYSDNKPNWYYEVIAPGFKYNLTDLAAAIGIEQLKKTNLFRAKRAEMANLYLESLKRFDLILPYSGKTADEHSWHLFTIRLGDSVQIKRDEFIDKMGQLGIICSVHFIPLHLHPYWKNSYNLSPNDFPVAQFAYERIVSLPLYTKMSNTDQLKVIKGIESILK